MGFSTGKYAKIWEITHGDRSTKVRISTSKKVNDKYEQDFSGFVTLSGTAHQEASNLKVGDTFRIGECSVTTRYDKEKKKEFINFHVYSFASNDQKTAPAAKPASAPSAPAEEDPDSELPF